MIACILTSFSFNKFRTLAEKKGPSWSQKLCIWKLSSHFTKWFIYNNKYITHTHTHTHQPTNHTHTHTQHTHTTTTTHTQPNTYFDQLLPSFPIRANAGHNLGKVHSTSKLEERFELTQTEDVFILTGPVHVKIHSRNGNFPVKLE